MKDILFIDKPKGWSSFDVIRHLRKRLYVQKMGHAGTLDPMATGLLIIGVGKGTKRLTEFIGLPKTYRMRVLLGKRTATGDLEGEVQEERAVVKPDKRKVEEVLAGMVGEIELPIPMYSAVKYKGKPLYRYARQGIAVPVKMRTSRIRRLRLCGVSREGACPEPACSEPVEPVEGKGWVLDIELEADKGTYARAVAEEIGSRLGAPATLAGLRRIKIGDYDVGEAEAFDDIRR